jgi:hypothetical protein
MHAGDIRTRRRLQPPLGLASGSPRHSRSSFWTLRPLLLRVCHSLAIAAHRSKLAIDHQCRTSLENCPTGEQFPSDLPRPSDPNPATRIRSQYRIGTSHSEFATLHSPVSPRPNWVKLEFKSIFKFQKVFWTCKINRK